MPEGARYVGRPTRWGNPLRVEPGDDRLRVVNAYARRYGSALRDRAREELADRDLCCWCPPDAACHADIVLCWANPDLPHRFWLATWGTMTALVEAKTYTGALTVTLDSWPHASVRAATGIERATFVDLLAETRELGRARTADQRRAVLGVKPTWIDEPLFV